MAVHTGLPAGRGLTVGYLEHLARLGTDLRELPATAVASERLAVAYRGRFLPCPVFLEPGESGQIARDMLLVHDLLAALPDRLFGGDRVAFGRALGLTEPTLSLVRRAPSGPPTALARADLYRAADGFKLLELNITSALGGFENADINRAMLRHPALSSYAAERDLAFSDTFQAIVDTLRFELGDRADGRRPVVALADWPESYQTYAPRLGVMAGLFDELGIDAIPCHVGHFAEVDGALTVHGRAVDAVFRFFLLEEILTQADLALVEPVMAAAERGEVVLFSRIDAELYGNKGALAMLSDDRNTHLFDDAERECLRRFLPWTRYVRQKTTTEDGGTVDMSAYAREHQRDLILKPIMLHGGAGITAGWQVDADEWATRVAAAMDEPWVLQRRVRPEPEPFPVVGSDTYQDMYMNWGTFVADPRAVGGDGYAGCIVRGTTDAEVGVVSMGTGALVGCCFHPDTEHRSRQGQ
ncbi:hypothetical protein [Actinokineospora xionganensis]|uniref:Glutathionylspermidine synthase pre-ATP-grasp-like domain-containing protein n=1 Tax=Actinokineospora xionganensis TaxID=2684470 RepID=A0ABR7L089_9PSEU|nr:hypothetical protein [Actinokineospora xionganensis]MBC6446096.1 hypothetical protein [Actinokineospora xionganensis]